MNNSFNQDINLIVNTHFICLFEISEYIFINSVSFFIQCILLLLARKVGYK